MLNLRLVPGRFSPTSGPVGAIGYQELIFLRFQGLIWHIWGFCIFPGSGDIRKNVKGLIFGNFLFCKKSKKRLIRMLPSKCSKRTIGLKPKRDFWWISYNNFLHITYQKMQNSPLYMKVLEPCGSGNVWFFNLFQL